MANKHRGRRTENRKFVRVILIGLFLMLLLVLWLFGGVYKDDEFAGKFFFIKHKPAWKWSFYSPRAMSDLPLTEMSEEQKKEQAMYDQFVPNRLGEFPMPF